MTLLPADLRLQQAIAGDDVALTELIRTHHAPLLRFGQRVCANPMDADDAVQEAFLRLARRTDLPRETSTLAWLFTVVRNQCLRFLRRARLLRQRLLRAAAEPPMAAELTPEQLLSRYRIGELVRTALAEIEPTYRQVLVLRDIEGLSGEQVCAALELSEAAMKSRLHRARANLRKALERSAAEAEAAAAHTSRARAW
jgi:RNA polymerase sigma-70 factor, ECF subfamily